MKFGTSYHVAPRLAPGYRGHSAILPTTVQVTGHSCSPGELDAISDAQMTSHAYLATHNNVVTSRNRSGNSDLRHQEIVPADVAAVSDHDQIAELRALANDGRADRRSIHGAVGAQFHIIFDHHIADLRNLVVCAVMCRVTESVLAHDTACVKDDTIAQDTAVVNRNIGNQNFTITVLDNIKNQENQFLPRSYVVRYWDAKTGTLQRTQTVLNQWKRVGPLDLPAKLMQISSSASGLTVRNLELSGHKLLGEK